MASRRILKFGEGRNTRHLIDIHSLWDQTLKYITGKNLLIPFGLENLLMTHKIRRKANEGPRFFIRHIHVY